LEAYNEFLNNLSKIEKNGLFTTDGWEYTNYNPYTYTGRPSNSFNGINYSALNKSDNTRERFVSRFGNGGFLLEIDMKAFHMSLLAKLVGYTFPTDDIYGYLGRSYPVGTDSKEETFRQIYGGISDEYLHNDFFAKVKELTNSLYWKYISGNLKTFLYNRTLDIPDLTPVKTLNYMLQSFETEYNGYVISKIMSYLYDRQTKMILYTYDSFLFDFSKADGRETLDGLVKQFDGEPVHVKIGKNYGNMLTLS
jgi:hypothetical protein